MSLAEFAEAELRRAGLYDEDSDYGGMMGPAVLEVVKVFAKQGHSGASAGIASACLDKLLRHEPLSPLTGADDEWNEIGPEMFQNKRCSHVFKERGVAYDSEGKIFRDKDGTCTQRLASRVPITFPYTPTTEIVDVE